MAACACTGSDERPEDDRPGPIWLGPDEWDPLACAWEDRVDGGANVVDSADVLALASDGGVVVGGSIHHSAEDDAHWLRRYSATGEVVWTTESALKGGFGAVALDSRDRVGATGVIGGYAMHLWVGKYRATGALAWSVDLGTEGSGADVCFAPTGELYATGSVVDPEHSSATFVWVGKFAGDGTLLWDHTEAGVPSNNTRGVALVCDPSGGVVVVGQLRAEDDHGESWIRRFDPAGDELWTTIIRDPQGTSPDQILFDDTGDQLLVAVQLADGTRLYRLALADGAITADMPAPENHIFAADAGGTFVDGNFAHDTDPECRNDFGDPCELVPYWGYAYYDWNAELVWWRAATSGEPDEESQNAMHSLAAGDGVRVLAGVVEDDIWVCHE